MMKFVNLSMITIERSIFK